MFKPKSNQPPAGRPIFQRPTTSAQAGKPVGAGLPEFISNPEPRCPCVLVLDTSGSMAGTRIDQLNEGVSILLDEIRRDPIACSRVELAIVTFGPVKVVQQFSTIDRVKFSPLRPAGKTPMGGAVASAFGVLDKRRSEYLAAGVRSYAPWMFLISDGSATDSDSGEYATSTVRAKQEAAGGALNFYAVAVDNADVDGLGAFTDNPLRIEAIKFRDLFHWMSSSLAMVSRGNTRAPVPKLTPELLRSIDRV